MTNNDDDSKRLLTTYCNNRRSSNYTSRASFPKGSIAENSNMFPDYYSSFKVTIRRYMTTTYKLNISETLCPKQTQVFLRTGNENKGNISFPECSNDIIAANISNYNIFVFSFSYKCSMY